VAGSRTFYIAFVVVLLYLMKFDREIRKFCFTFAALVLVGFFIKYYYSPDVLENSHIMAQYIFTQKKVAIWYSTTGLTNVLPFPHESAMKNLVYILFGQGLVKLSIMNKFAGYSVHVPFEFRLAGVLFAKLGLAGLFILGWLFLKMFRIENFDRDIVFYKASLIPFALSSFHYLELFSRGLCEMFFSICALIVAYVINNKRKQSTRSLPHFPYTTLDNNQKINTWRMARKKK